MAIDIDNRTEEEIEEFRQKRIKQFVWIVRNIVDVQSNIAKTGDPDGLRTMLLNKLMLELTEFISG